MTMEDYKLHQFSLSLSSLVFHLCNICS